MAVDSSGDVFIADNGNQRVVEVTPSGTQTTILSGLDQPDGLALDPAGNLFVADSGNKRVIEMTPTGIQTTVFTGSTILDGLAVDGAGDLFVLVGESHLFKVTPGLPVPVTMDPTSTRVSASSLSSSFTQGETFSATVSVPDETTLRAQVRSPFLTMGQSLVPRL